MKRKNLKSKKITKNLDSIISAVAMRLVTEVKNDVFLAKRGKKEVKIREYTVRRVGKTYDIIRDNRTIYHSLYSGSLAIGIVNRLVDVISPKRSMQEICVLLDLERQYVKVSNDMIYYMHGISRLDGNEDIRYHRLYDCELMVADIKNKMKRFGVEI